jgi:hypothetical protein
MCIFVRNYTREYGFLILLLGPAYEMMLLIRILNSSYASLLRSRWSFSICESNSLKSTFMSDNVYSV